jgi:hypothetical protein
MKCVGGVISVGCSCILAIGALNTVVPLQISAQVDNVGMQQLAGPDITKLSEKKGGISSVDDPRIIELYRTAIAALAAMALVVDKPLEQRKKLYEDYFDLDAQLTDFFESSSLGKAMIQETLKADQSKQAAQHAEVTAARLKLQAVDPDAITNKKEQLKKTLNICDAQIAKMREIELEAHRNTMNIVNQATLQDAQALSEKVCQQAHDLKTRAQDVLEKIANDFQTEAKEVRTLLQTFKESLRNLQETWAQAQAADEAALKAATEAANAQKTVQAPQQQQLGKSISQQQQPEQKPSDQKLVEETFIQHLGHRIVDVAQGAWDVIKNTGQWFMTRIGYGKAASQK